MGEEAATEIQPNIESLERYITSEKAHRNLIFFTSEQIGVSSCCIQGD